MKRLIALILVCLVGIGTAYAAEWKEGLSPSKPYTGSKPADLETTMGYMALYPNATKKNNIPEHFCDVLEMYFPREDITLGEGNLTLYDESGEVFKVSFTDSDCVELRKLEEVELDHLMWGSGVCVDIHLPFSLKFDTSYYVLMEEHCLDAMDGKVTNPPITNVEAWCPQVTGDYGISYLYYSAPVETANEEAGEEEEKKETTKAEEAGPVEYKVEPGVGDAINFDLVLGGEAKVAVVYSENDSVYFENIEYTESGTVTGTITGEELDWGVVFLDEEGNLLYNLDLK